MTHRGRKQWMKLGSLGLGLALLLAACSPHETIETPKTTTGRDGTTTTTTATTTGRDGTTTTTTTTTSQGTTTVGKQPTDAYVDLEQVPEMAAPGYTIIEPPPFEDPFNTEEYGVFDENRFRSVLQAPFSTFAADVDTASYAIIRRKLADGELPQRDGVRIEEMLNYFRYDYDAPTGDEPFAVSFAIGDTPWNADTKLLRIGLQAEEVAEAVTDEGRNLVYLIDVSGSMEQPDKLPLVKRAFRLLTEQMGPRDRVSIVTYASQDATLLTGASADDTPEILSAIENLRAGGSTHGSAGIETAYELAQQFFIEGGTNRVILATDGDLNVGVTSEGELTRLIEEKRDSGIFLSVMGFGVGNIKDNKMEALANHGNGTYSYIDTIQETRRVLVDQFGATLHTVAKDVKLQVEFNPAQVAGYRLIGYENRVMPDEDFVDDSKDGGEIGSGHQITVLYEIALQGSAQDIPDLPERRYTEPTKTGDEPETTLGEEPGDFDPAEILNLKLRYKAPDGERSSEMARSFVPEGELKHDSELGLPAEMQLASLVAAFGMQLRGSDYLPQDFDVLALTKELGAAEEDPLVSELVELVATAQRLGAAKSD